MIAMRKYLSFFTLRFSCGLQYRVAAWAGVVTQFAWGFMEIMMFNAFYEAEPSAFPMTLEATVTKLMYLMKKYGKDYQTIRTEFYKPINYDIAKPEIG